MSASAPLGLVLPGDLDGPIRPRLEFAFRVACGWLGRKAILLQEDTEPDFPFVRYGTDIPALYRPLCEPLRSIPIHGADSAGRADNLGEIFSWISSEIEHYQPDDRWGRKLYSGSLQHRTGLGPHEVPALDSAASLFPQVPMPNVRLIAPTHDVDFLPTSRCDVLVRGMKNSAIHLRAKDPIGAAAVFIKTLLTLAGQQHFRPLSHWVETEARYGFRGSYYFITENSHDKDGNYTTAQAVQSAGVLSDLGAEVGIHGSWSSLDTETGLQAQYEHLSESMGGRQHYLRQGGPNVLTRSLLRTGAEYDSTLGWPDSPGFRHGTSLPFPLYDFDSEQATEILEIPLVLMDVSLNKKNMDLVDHILRSNLPSAFAVLWHDTVLSGMQHPRFAGSLYWELPQRSDHHWRPASEIAQAFRETFKVAGVWT